MARHNIGSAITVERMEVVEQKPKSLKKKLLTSSSINSPIASQELIDGEMKPDNEGDKLPSNQLNSRQASDKELSVHSENPGELAGADDSIKLEKVPLTKNANLSQENLHLPQIKDPKVLASLNDSFKSNKGKDKTSRNPKHSMHDA